MNHLKNLKVVITAGASGIGSEIAIALSKSSAKVIICDINKDLIESFSAKNPEIEAIKLQMDVIVEVHTPEEAKNALKFDQALIGIVTPAGQQHLGLFLET